VNLFGSLPDASAAERVDALLTRPGRAIALCRRERGSTSRPCDWLDIAPHRRHRVDWTDPMIPTVWLAIFYR